MLHIRMFSVSAEIPTTPETLNNLMMGVWAADTLVRWARDIKMRVVGERTQLELLVLSHWARYSDCLIRVA